MRSVPILLRLGRGCRDGGDARAINPIAANLKDEDWNVRQTAAWALGEIGDGRIIDSLGGLSVRDATFMSRVKQKSS